MNMTKQARVSGVILTAAAFVYYALNTAGYAFPNEWSAALGSIVGMDPFRPLSRPVWQFIMYGFALLPGAGILTAANVLNAVLGAVAVWLAFLTGYRLMAKQKFARTEDEKAQIQMARLVSGLVTAGFLAVSMPVLIVATRAHPLMLDLCLILGVLLLALKYRDENDIKYWYAFTVLYGIGISEFATFITLFPFFVMLWVWLFWTSRKINIKAIVIGLLLIGAGSLIGVLFCWGYYKSTIAEWRQFDSFYLVYKHFIVDQVNQLRFSVPKHGWLVVLLSMVLPALFVLRFDYHADHDVFTKISLYFFRLILVAVSFVLLFNLPGSPWHVIGPNVLLVTPYLIAALWIGQLAGFLHHGAANPEIARMQRRRKPNPILKHSVIMICAVAIISAGFLNMSEARPGRGEPLAELSRDILDGVSGQRYLLSNGSIDTVMQWEAYKSGHDLHVINPVMSSSQAYRRFMNTWFQDPSLESISVIGFTPLLDHWMTSNSNIVEDFAVQSSPELWSLQGFSWIPSRGVYKGRELSDETLVMPEELTETNFSFLEKHLPYFDHEVEWPAVLKDKKRYMAKYLGVFANNVGFRLASQGDWEAAKKAFELALRYNDGNLSAIINLGAIADREGDEEQLELLKEMYSRKQTLMPAQLSPRQLIRQHGYVRNKSIFMQEGLALVEAGMSRRGMQLIEEAGGFENNTGSEEMSLAGALFGEGRFNDSMKVYQRVIEGNAGNVDAWVGVARCYQMLNMVEEAESVFSRLIDMDVPEGQLAMERGFLSLRLGKNDEALSYFKKGLKHEPSRGPSAAGMIWAGLELKEIAAVSEAESVLEELPRYYLGQMMLYELSMARKDVESAYEHIIRVLMIQPGNVDALEKVIRLELLEGREAEAKQWLDRLLAIDSSNAYGNYLLSGIHEQDGRLDLAENALRRALLSGPDAEVFYGLAWILEKQRKNRDALEYAEKALKINPGNPQFVAVKGIVLSSMGEWGEAEKLLRKAIQLRTDRDVPLFNLSLARVLSKQGKSKEAQELVDAALVIEGDLTDFEREILSDLTGSD